MVHLQPLSLPRPARHGTNEANTDCATAYTLFGSCNMCHSIAKTSPTNTGPHQRPQPATYVPIRLGHTVCTLQQVRLGLLHGSEGRCQVQRVREHGMDACQPHQLLRVVPAKTQGERRIQIRVWLPTARGGSSEGHVQHQAPVPPPPIQQRTTRHRPPPSTDPQHRSINTHTICTQPLSLPVSQSKQHNSPRTSAHIPPPPAIATRGTNNCWAAKTTWYPPRCLVDFDFVHGHKVVDGFTKARGFREAVSAHLRVIINSSPN